MNIRAKLMLVAISAITLAGCQDQAGSGGTSRDAIRAVGSSTVYPFATLVGERFAEGTGNRKPQIESTGTGGGMERFCGGIGPDTPDISNASRRMKKSEFERCMANGVTEIIELEIGFDGLAFGESVNGPNFALTLEDVYKALAAKPFGQPNNFRTWRDVNPNLPAVAISVLGPPTTSGTYDSFKELVFTVGCETNPAMKALKDSDADAHRDICGTLRGSPFYVEQGENDNLIISKLNRNPNSVGAFGFSYLEGNLDKIRPIPLNGVAPSVETINSGAYPGSRAMFIYIKKAHLDIIPGLKEYAAEFLKAGQEGGYLKAIGLIPPHKDGAAKANANLANLAIMDGSELK